MDNGLKPMQAKTPTHTQPTARHLQSHCTTNASHAKSTHFGPHLQQLPHDAEHLHDDVVTQAGRRNRRVHCSRHVSDPALRLLGLPLVAACRQHVHHTVQQGNHGARVVAHKRQRPIRWTCR